MTAIPLGAPLPTRSSHLPADVTRAASMSAYLVLLRMEVAAFHPLLRSFTCAGSDSSLWPCSSPSSPRERQLIASGRYPASCSVEPGLSSPLAVCTTKAAAVWLASRS